MIKNLIIFWFKTQSNNYARIELIKYFNKKEVREILKSYWKDYQQLKKDVPSMPTLGGSVMVNLAAMSTAFYNSLLKKNKTKEEVTNIFYSIAWKVYKIMGRNTWYLTRLSGNKTYSRLKCATNLFRTFPFNSPSYLWEDIQTTKETVSFNCIRCPVAEYFKTKDLSEFCVQTWCALDFPLAQMWESQLDRNNTIAGGAEECDFRWKPNTQNKVK